MNTESKVENRVWDTVQILTNAFIPAAKLSRTGPSTRAIFFDIYLGRSKSRSRRHAGLEAKAMLNFYTSCGIQGSHMYLIPVQRWTQNSVENNTCSTGVLTYDDVFDFVFGARVGDQHPKVRVLEEIYAFVVQYGHLIQGCKFLPSCND